MRRLHGGALLLHLRSVQHRADVPVQPAVVRGPLRAVHCRLAARRGCKRAAGDSARPLHLQPLLQRVPLPIREGQAALCFPPLHPYPRVQRAHRCGRVDVSAYRRPRGPRGRAQPGARMAGRPRLEGALQALQAALLHRPHGNLRKGPGGLAAPPREPRAPQGAAPGALRGPERFQEDHYSALHPPGQGRPGGAGLCGRDLGQEIRGESPLQPPGVLRRLHPGVALDFHPLARLGPHGRAGEVLHGQGDGLSDQVHLPRAGAGAQGRGADKGGDGDGAVGRSAELPPGGQLDAHTGPTLRGVRHGQHQPGVPALVHLAGLAQVPRDHPAERSEDDQRAAQGSPRQHEAHLYPGPHQRRGVHRRLLQAPRVQAAPHGPRLLPRRCAGAAQVRAAGVEHPLRVQHLRHRVLDDDAQDVPGGAAHHPLGVPELRDRADQLRRARDGRPGPPVPDEHPQQVLQPAGAAGRVQVHALGDVLRAPRGRPGELQGLHLKPPSDRGSRGVWDAPERADHVPDAGDAQEHGHAAGHPAEGQHLRWRQVPGRDRG
mmetsp:Transcript_5668/g.19251  ORF Transcript_5668/g.19251 Transcript_5668/m.19251 type:complete len:545 (-) Transcript_5668:937-2571(-)